MSEIAFFDYLRQYKSLKGEILNAVEGVFASGQLILGSQVESFEENFTKFLGVRGYSIGVNSGTDAIAIALKALGVRANDEVITVANTAVPTVSAICSIGAKPVFCDVDEKTALIDIHKLPRCITNKTKAIVPVHLFGNVVDILEIQKIIAGKNIVIVEDCAQAHAACLGSHKVGTLGDASAFSFYPTKNLGAYGDAGICFTRDSGLAKEIEKIRMYGFNGSFYSEREGLNSRMDEVQAAILNVKLPYLNSYIDKRRKLANLYDDHLDPKIKRFSPKEGVSHAYHLYVISLENRDQVRLSLKKENINTGIHYPYAIHLMKAYQYLGYTKGDLPQTESLADQVLSLPLYPELEEGEVITVCNALNQLM